VIATACAGAGHSRGVRGQRIERGFGFFEELAVFGFLLFEAFDHAGRSFLQERLIRQLAFGIGDCLFESRDFLGEPFALGGYVDLLVIDNSDVGPTN
jgi:hypothetical protein